MKKMIIVLFIFTAFLSSCGNNITEGEVFCKEFHPAHTTIILIPIIHSTGKSSFTTLMPIPFFFPDSWSVDFKAYNEKKNKWQERRVWVSKEVYDAVPDKAWYKMTENDLVEQPKIKAQGKTK